MTIAAEYNQICYAISKGLEIVYFKLDIDDGFSSIKYTKYVDQKYLPNGFDATLDGPYVNLQADDPEAPDPNATQYLFAGKEYIPCNVASEYDGDDYRTRNGYGSLTNKRE